MPIPNEYPLKHMKCYISGKITGLPEDEAKYEFERASKLAYIDFLMTPLNPMKFTHNHDRSWNSFMKEDLKQMMKCDAIYMIYNWKNSKGAIIEHDLAKKLGFVIIYESRFRIRLLESVKIQFFKRIFKKVFGIHNNVYLSYRY